LPHSQLLGLVRWINELETVNNQFKETFSNRSANGISTTAYDTKKLRTNLLSTYSEMAEYIAVMSKRTTNQAYYLSIMEILNSGRKYYADILAKRNGNNIAAKKKEATV
jgi:hypothetical protein